jgi:hypothetical protein
VIKRIARSIVSGRAVDEPLNRAQTLAAPGLALDRLRALDRRLARSAFRLLLLKLSNLGEQVRVKPLADVGVIAADQRPSEGVDGGNVDPWIEFEPLNDLIPSAGSLDSWGLRRRGRL